MSAEKLRVYKRKWALMYQAAVNEADERRRLQLIARAQGAICERQQALAHSRLEVLGEQHALEDAGYVLAAMQKAAEFNLRRAHPQIENLTGTG